MPNPRNKKESLETGTTTMILFPKVCNPKSILLKTSIRGRGEGGADGAKARLLSSYGVVFGLIRDYNNGSFNTVFCKNVFHFVHTIFPTIVHIDGLVWKLRRLQKREQ